MTASTSRSSTERAPASALDAEWRIARERHQEAALAGGSTVVSCSATPGQGGLGRHLREVLDALERCGERFVCAAPATRVSPGARLGLLAASAPSRLSPAWRTWRGNLAFDLATARSLPPGERLIAFNGQALEQFRVARRRGVKSLALMSATTHIRAVARQHAIAQARHPIEPSWAGRLLRRSLLEYSQAERIYVSTRHAWESFLDEGVAEERLSLFPLTPAARFAPEPAAQASTTFDVVYVGGLSVVKGVAVLLDAFTGLAHRDMRLLLVGGAETRGMRRHIARARARDPRIEVSPGDPLPVLCRARLCVHPSYSDGFGYAPAEALACGVPAIVSEDTGMKELIAAGAKGLVLPTGDVRALAEAIDCAYRGEILSTRTSADAT
jgi:glycosyltransferase involved in cell wall biosynthesis